MTANCFVFETGTAGWYYKIALFQNLCTLFTTIYRLAFRHFLEPCCLLCLTCFPLFPAHLCPQSTPRLRNSWNGSVPWQRLQLQVKLSRHSLMHSRFTCAAIQFQLGRRKKFLCSLPILHLFSTAFSPEGHSSNPRDINRFATGLNKHR